MSLQNFISDLAAPYVNIPEDVVVPLLAAFVFNLLVYFFGQLLQNHSLSHLFTPMLQLILLLLALLLSHNWFPNTITFFALFLIYATRTTLHNVVKFGHEEKKYRHMREQFNDAGAYMHWLGFLVLYIIYSLYIYLISVPAIHLILFGGQGFNVLAIAGIGLMIFGIIFQAIADWQLMKHRSFDPKNKRIIFKRGLWHYSRHPNFFGELCMFWGISMMAWSLPLGIYTITAPILQTIVMRWIGTVPEVEEKLQGKRGYSVYEQETNIFVPWFAKRAEVPEEPRQFIRDDLEIKRLLSEDVVTDA